MKFKAPLNGFSLTLWIFAGVALLGAGCGGSSSSSPAPASATTAGNTAGTVSAAASSLVSDSSSSMAVLGAQLDDTTSSLAAGDSSTNASALSLGADVTYDITRTRSCSANGSGTAEMATVTINFSGSGSATDGAYVVSENDSGSQVRVWTNPGTGVGCTLGAKYAKINWTKTADVNGLNLNVTDDRGRTLSTVYTNASGSSATRVATTMNSGTRGVTWATTSTAVTTGTTTKTITSSDALTYTLQKFDGNTLDLSGTYATGSGAPLVVTTTRNSDGVPTSHLIVSGTETATKTNDFYITSAYSNVLFDLTGSDPCVPTSGSITTDIYTSASSGTALASYTVTFSGTGVSVTGTTDSSATASLNLSTNIDHKCDFVGGD